MGRRLTVEEHLDRATTLLIDRWYERFGDEVTRVPRVVRCGSPRAACRGVVQAVARSLNAERIAEFVAATYARGGAPCGCRICVPTGDPRRNRLHREDAGCWCAVCAGRVAEWGMRDPDLIADAALADLEVWPAGHDTAMWSRTDDRASRVLAVHAGWWYLNERLVVVSAPAEFVLRDPEGRLHADTGPAARYPDGWTVWARRGVLVPSGVGDGTWTAAQILRVSNLEVRRELIDAFGPGRYVKDLHGLQLDADETGELWEVGDPQRWGGRMRLLKVVDATPTAEGERREYWLHVPPQMWRARQAVAWTFGMEAEEYRPLVET